MPNVRPTNTVAELLRTVRLSDLAERLGLAVVKKGTHLTTLCPFHDDHVPSLTLYDEHGKRGRPHFYCYACGASGDIFHLTQKIKQVDFTDAVSWLAQSYGVQRFNRRQARSSTPKTILTRDKSDSERGYEVALQIYRERSDPNLLRQWLQFRALPASAAETADLAYAIPHSLISHLRDARQTNSEWRATQGALEAAGLLCPVKDNTRHISDYYLDLDIHYRDFFFDTRVIFPIHDLEDRIVGFAGRLAGDTRESGGAKYLFTPRLPKTQLLYRANVAWKRILEAKRKSSDKNEFEDLYICEGLVDAIRLETLGLRAVSLLGSQATDGQVSLIADLAEKVSSRKTLRCHIFLDRDRAGVRGAAKLISALTARNIECTFVSPSSAELRSFGVGRADQKDPDSILATADPMTAHEDLQNWRRAAALAVLANELERSPEDLIDERVWNDISPSRRYRAAYRLAPDRRSEALLLHSGALRDDKPSERWYSDVLNYRRSPSSSPTIQSARQSTFIDDANARLNRARALAKSGAERGELPSDESAWRRIELAATAFNEVVRARLALPLYESLEPLDAVLVSRGFGKEDPRLKVMPCPEDLISQQYVLSELLTERYDVGAVSTIPFSFFVPAVRYYRESGTIETTAESGYQERNAEPLSFAYQIDMDVLEGRRTATDQGMFRPFSECWRDFITSLRTKGEKLGEVHAVRLDVRRYYDNLSRAVVRNQLRDPLFNALGTLQGSDARWAEYFPDDGQNRSDKVVDWLCDQSFGYQYYDPSTGKVARAKENIGVPQGPVLSAWLATVALFPLDAALRRTLNEINGENAQTVKCWYARYVDDIFLIASSPDVLRTLRSVAEDAAKNLGLELVQKEDPLPKMRPEEFRQMLVEGRMTVGSGPSEEPTVLHMGDGESGIHAWQDPDLQRSSALGLLNDHRLYMADSANLIDQLYTALRAPDLRPSELPKLARWLWYRSAEKNSDSTTDLWNTYWISWTELTKTAPWKIKPTKNAWEDPTFYALDGLDMIFSSPNALEKNLSAEEKDRRQGRRIRLANFVLAKDFLEGIKQNPEAGQGYTKLSRMFFQRYVGIRWKAHQLLGRKSTSQVWAIAEAASRLNYNEIMASLVRAQFTESETTGAEIGARASQGDLLNSRNPLRDLLVWLHHAVVLLRQGGNEPADPLAPIAGQLLSIETFYGHELNDVYRIPQIRDLLQLLKHWSPGQTTIDSPSERIARAAFMSFVSICPRDIVLECLNRRPSIWGALDKSRLLPPFPGIPTASLSTVKSKPAGLTNCEEVATISQVVLEGTESPAIDSDQVFMSATVEGGPKKFLPRWEAKHLSRAELVGVSLLQKSAAWEPAARFTFVSAPPPCSPVTFQHLQWAAAAFDSLSRINNAASETTEDPVEYIPAWPYVTFSEVYPSESVSAKSVEYSLLSPSIPKRSLGSSAFIRDGSGTLKAAEVPIADAWVWRIGFAITDLLGYADELDKYRKIAEPTALTNETLPAPEYLLKAMLRRLRGDFAPPSELPRHPIHGHLPATVFRALELLRNFPKSDDQAIGLAYVLSVELESKAMEARSRENWTFGRPGEASKFLESISTAAMSRLPERWADSLPDVSIVNSALTKRRSVYGWHTLAARISALETNITPENLRLLESNTGWRALVSGIRLSAIVAWVRSLNLELESDGRFPVPAQLDLPPQWDIADPALVHDSSPESLYETYRDVVTSGERSRKSLNSVAPLGWLLLLSARLHLYDDQNQTLFKEPQVTRDGVNKIARLLTVVPNSKNASAEWPFEHAAFQIDELQRSVNYEEALTLLAEIDTELEFDVEQVVGNAWGYKDKPQQFVDARGATWKCPRWMIDQVPLEKRVEEVPDGRLFKKIWTETRNKAGELIGISALGRRFANLLRPASDFAFLDLAPHDSNRIPVATATDSEHSVRDESDSAPQRRIDSERASEDDLSSVRKNVSGPSSTDADRIIPERGDRGSEKKQPLDSDRRVWQAYQEAAWKVREQKASNHIRVALFQFRVNNSYIHPLFEVGLPTDIEDSLDKEGKELRHGLRDELVASLISKSIETPSPNGEKPKEEAPLESSPLQVAKAASQEHGHEHLWTQSDVLPSWTEHRRRRLLAEALRACESLKVELLVLPEYSIRPDTVAWLKQWLARSGSRTSVVAGTYRLHGNLGDLHFKERFSGIFGVPDTASILGDIARSQAQEKASLITLLHPLPQFAEPDSTLVFTRRKKYPSVAMSEVFNPSTDPWGPLLTIEVLISRLAAFLRSVPPEQAVRETVDLARAFPAAERIAEMICSELFLSTHPANWQPIADEYQRLSVRFGKPTADPQSVVQSDLKEFSRYLGYVVKDEKTEAKIKGDRRTIIVVPAYTTRSADYWVYGQSALLAAGITTVFCAAVSEDSRGGSCFIGKNSWDGTEPISGLPLHQTPYCGWSKGIYYKNPIDALSATEQAMVVADIDPIYMNEGKPRQQTLPVPLQLVAYLPVVESANTDAFVSGLSGLTTISSKDGLRSARLPKGVKSDFQVSEISNALIAALQGIGAALVSPLNPAPRSTYASLFELGMSASLLFSNGESFSERLKVWKKDWRQVPSYGAPPVLTDWLWVDLTPMGKIDDLFVPPWVDDPPERTS